MACPPWGTGSSTGGLLIPSQSACVMCGYPGFAGWVAMGMVAAGLCVCVCVCVCVCACACACVCTHNLHVRAYICSTKPHMHMIVCLASMCACKLT